MRIEFGMGLGLLEPERIELCLEMATDPVGPDHHECAHRIPRGAHDLVGGQLDAGLLGLFPDLVAQFTFDRQPVESRALTSSPLAAIGQSARCQDGPRASEITAVGSSLRAEKKARHLSSTFDGSS
jgi:hypothetical protein